MEHPLPISDEEAWRRFVAAERQFVNARMALFRTATSLVALVRAALDRPEERAAALNVAAFLPLEVRDGRLHQRHIPARAEASQDRQRRRVSLPRGRWLSFLRVQQPVGVQEPGLGIRIGHGVGQG